MRKIKHTQGQSLFEVIVALAIVALVAVGLVRATSFSVKNTRFSTDQSKLTALIQKRINQIIDHKNNNSKAFFEGQYFPSSEDFPCVGSLTSCTEESEAEDYCLRINVLDSTNDILSIASADPSAKMVTIIVDAYWEKDRSGTDCGAFDYNHNLSFKTNVTN
jgi:type II secretory pathway pseudopilin PulG